jgi:hypothetical protein
MCLQPLDVLYIVGYLGIRLSYIDTWFRLSVWFFSLSLVCFGHKRYQHELPLCTVTQKGVTCVEIQLHMVYTGKRHVCSRGTVPGDTRLGHTHIVMYLYCYVMCSFVSLSILTVPFCVFYLIVLFCVLFVCKCVPDYCYRDIGDFSTTLTEVFPCFFLSCKANVRVQDITHKDGAGPVLTNFCCCYVCSILCILCTDCV